MELVIEDCDTITFTILVDHMYGIEIPESVIFEDMQIYIKLLEMSDMWLMDNLKASVEELFAKHLFQSLPFPNLEGKRLLRACGARDRKVKGGDDQTTCLLLLLPSFPQNNPWLPHPWLLNP